MTNEKTQQDLKVENLEIKGEIELPKLDVKQYIGKRAKIDRVEVFKNDQYGYYVEIETEAIDHLGVEGKKQPLTVKRRAWISENRETGDLGWTKESALGKIIARNGVNHFNELQGKEVIIQTEVKDGREWLTF